MTAPLRMLPDEPEDQPRIDGTVSAGALRKLFDEHGYDLANGDVLYHGPALAFMVPPQYRAQVARHPDLDGAAMWFMRNPRFSLF